MKYKVLNLLIALPLVSYSQGKKPKIDFEIWKKAVVNIETQGPVYPNYFIDSVMNSKMDSGYSKERLDSLKKILQSFNISTGTAIYMKYGDRKYLVTAKHVLSDDVYIAQKKYENQKGINTWDTLEAIRPVISIRTNFDYYTRTKLHNNFGIVNRGNFIKGSKPYFFINDSTGDGLGVISLQEKNYMLLDSLLQLNGYSPIVVENVCTGEEISELDEIYAIGFPEGVSIVAKADFPNVQAVFQTGDLVIPLIVKGTVAMYKPEIQHFYVDLTITPGNSGGPIIKNGKLIGVVSGINKYKIINEGVMEISNSNLYGIGHLVNIINTNELMGKLETYKAEEDKLLAAENKN